MLIIIMHFVSIVVMLLRDNMQVRISVMYTVLVNVTEKKLKLVLTKTCKE